jgi:hypothetical protein
MCVKMKADIKLQTFSCMLFPASSGHPHITSVKEKMCFMPQKVDHTLWLAEFKLYTHVQCKFNQV